MDVLTSKLLDQLFAHARSWLANLQRARGKRKQESVQALRRVVVAARETAVYLRQLKEAKRRDHAVERQLAKLWTELGFALEDLGIHKLAKRCQITGKHWSAPSHYDREFLDKADVSLERIEQLAHSLLAEIRQGT